jgi:hypothetical protein
MIWMNKACLATAAACAWWLNTPAEHALAKAAAVVERLAESGGVEAARTWRRNPPAQVRMEVRGFGIVVTGTVLFARPAGLTDRDQDR